MKTFLTGLSLFVLAIVLSYIILPFAILYTLLRYSGRGGYLKRCAFSIDQTGNAIAGRFFRDLLVQKEAPLLLTQWWGNPDKTISFALAKCAPYLTITGHILFLILETVDPGHMEKAIKYN